MRAPRVCVTNLGCRVNRVELDGIAGELARAGALLVGENEADAVVVNTCAVTGEAQAKARKSVRHAARLAQAPLVVATGCAASLFCDEFAGLGTRVVVEPDKSLVAARVLSELGAQASGTCQGAPALPRTRPGVKVQDGCDHRCAYCIVWRARGRARSLAADDAVRRVGELAAAGAGEVVLTGIDLGRYHDAALDLAGLLSRVLTETRVGRVRLSSVEPAGVSDALLDVMARSQGRVAPFLHVPLQAGANATLRRMARPYTAEGYLRMARRARDAVPGLALSCDLIVGFPGESEADFAESLAFCREMAFANMHVFRYSRRPGTPAAAMDGQVDPRDLAARSRSARALAAASRLAYARTLVGVEQLVCVEADGRGVTGGLVEALLDAGEAAGSLVRAVPSAVLAGSVLDARGAGAHGISS